MHARSAMIEVPAEEIDEAAAKFEREQLPLYEDLRGYRGFKLLADRLAGKIVGISFWDSAEDLLASDDVGRAARVSLTQEGAAEPVREAWEVLIDKSN